MIKTDVKVVNGKLVGPVKFEVICKCSNPDIREYRVICKRCGGASHTTNWTVESDYFFCPSELLMYLAKNGDPDAQYELGIRYDSGDRLPDWRNEFETIYWLVAAARKGHREAMEFLADTFEYEFPPLKKNLSAARVLYQASGNSYTANKLSAHSDITLGEALHIAEMSLKKDRSITISISSVAVFFKYLEDQLVSRDPYQDGSPKWEVRGDHRSNLVELNGLTAFKGPCKKVKFKYPFLSLIECDSMFSVENVIFSKQIAFDDLLKIPKEKVHDFVNVPIANSAHTK